MSSLEINISANLHPGQKEVFKSPARFKVLACGRRWGKSKLAAFMALVNAVQGKAAFWVSPSFPVSSIGWRTIKKMARDIPQTEIREADRRISFLSGGWLQVKSADNVDSLRGEGLDFAVLDEAAFMKADAWHEAIRPALADKQGKALFCSTPAGANWFYDVFNNKGQDWQAWHFKTTDNPFINPDEVASAKAELAERTFKQEFEAEFLTDGTGIFRNYNRCVKGAFEKPIAGVHYIMAVDLARTVDYTVISVWDMSRKHLVHLDRFNQVDWSVQQRRIAETAKRYNNAFCIIDATGVGDPIVQTLQRAGINVKGVRFNAQNKRQMVESLMVMLENEEISFPNHPEIIHELSIFTAEQSMSGVKYSAPSGAHDDIVMSFCLAVQHMRSGFMRQVAL